jgi:hypothetical protein
MFKEWPKVVQDINTNRNKDNIEKAEKLIKKYRRRGRILKILGILGIIAAVASFITFSIVEFDYNFIIVIVSGFLVPVFAFFIGVGFTYSGIANRIRILLDQPPLFQGINNNKCPNCGDIIKLGEVFCSKCGKKLEKICPKCGYSNDLSNNFCEKCGESFYN